MVLTLLIVILLLVVHIVFQWWVNSMMTDVLREMDRKIDSSEIYKDILESNLAKSFKRIEALEEHLKIKYVASETKVLPAKYVKK